MFTVCPKCALTLTVTAADLRIAQGFVRCGQCTNVFNALLALSDERQQTTSVHAIAAGEHPKEEESVEEDSAAEHPEDADLPREELAAEELEHEEFESEEDNAIEQTSLEFNPDAADVSEIFVEPETISSDDITGTYESIVLPSAASSASDEPPAPRSADEELNDQLVSLAARIEAARQNQLAQTNTGLQPLFMPLELEERAAAREPRPLLWRLGLAALVVLLGAQAVNHYRDELAVNPRLHRPLTALYALFGISLAPRWDLAAYEVHQLGASAASQNAGQLTVRASVRNDAAQPQPLPLLRVTLLDRFGNRLASRDVPPRAYLGGAAAAVAALLPPGERVDAQMAFVDPGKNAVGFEIDACLPTASTRVHCANDAAAR
jgi:predicted Zn finger-like uncharacterized protein